MLDVSATTEFRETCRKCQGRGRFIGWSGRDFGKCFTCDGVGYHMFRTSEDTRRKAALQRAARQERVAGEIWDGFKTEEPEIAAWIESSADTFEFARNMRDALVKYGSLTDGQLAACRKCVEARKVKAAERQARADNAPTVATDKLMAAFDAALASGLKRPIMRFETFAASLPKATSANAGGVYLKDGDTYLGKITGGRFHASRDCSPEQAQAIQATMADPLAAAVAYGKRIGACSCCGRTLTDPESVARGIGPICAENFGL